MTALVAVLRREYMERVRSRAFLIGTAALPVLVTLFVLVPTLLGGREESRPGPFLLVDRTGVLGPEVASALGEAGVPVTLESSPLTPEEVDQSVRGGGFEGAILLDEDALSAGRFQYRASSAPLPPLAFALQGAVSRAALRHRLEEGGGARAEGEEAGGEGLETLLRGGILAFQPLGGEGVTAPDREAGARAGFVGAFLLYMVLVLYGTTVLRAVLEEKSGRMVEIVLSTIRPRDLMLGKILGVGAVGLTQILAWIAVGWLLFRLPPALLPLASARAALAGGALPPLRLLPLLVAFFVLGYLLYAALYAAAGAVCAREEEAQQAQLPITFLQMIPVLVLAPLMADPDWSTGRVLALIPVFAPVLQFARAAAGAARAWEIGLSLGLLAVAIPLTAAAAGRIYRAGILIQGKRPGLGELWRMIREG